MLFLGIMALAIGWLLVYTGYAGIGIGDEIRHVFNPSKNPAPHPTNPRVA